MDYLLHLIEQYGLGLVFLNVLIEQLGTPLPSYPTLVITGALLERSSYSAPLLLAVAVLAALLADFTWYLAGKRYGRKVMSLLCRISLSPDSCVSQTESVYLRWGVSSLLVAKFIPGFASIASALAGALGTRPLKFMVFDSLGAALWAGSAIYLGSLFSTTVDDLLDVLVSLGKWGLLLVGIALCAFVAQKWWQRHRFVQSLCMARISVDELYQLMQTGEAPAILDVRSVLLPGESRIPGAVMISVNDPLPESLDLKPEGEVIVYCACPNEASAAQVARQLIKLGYSHVRPLEGGIDAWVAAGYSVTSSD
ncbi:MAG: DedA family protein/thiosulfate sulfurtransferase GlpE [Burkholderiaceae bacterium]|nr:DedA family protein/thiosulfate sulfurtransferase GlpE [Burkholderiaceae bacterium]